MVGIIAMRVWADVAIQQPNLARLHDSVGVLQVHPAFTRGLDFSSRKYKAYFEFFDDLVVVKGLTINCDLLHGLDSVPPGAVKTGGLPNRLFELFGLVCGVPNGLSGAPGIAPGRPCEGCGWFCIGNNGFCWTGC